MNKSFFILVVMFIFSILTGCATNEQLNQSQIDKTQTEVSQSSISQTFEASKKPRVTFEPWANYKNFLPEICFSWPNYRTLADLCERTQNIVVATVEDIEVFAQPIEEPGGAKTALRDTLIKYNINITQTIKGELSAGEKINVWQRGWEYDGINIFHSDIPPLDYDKTYLVNFNKNEYTHDTLDDSYYVGAPFEAYPEVIDGKLYPHQHSRLFFEGELLEEAIQEIQSVAFSVMPINIPIEESVGILTQWLINYAIEFTPARDLTGEELQEFYDFEDSNFVTAVIGKELQNGYKFVWIKTTELSKLQQTDFYDTLNAAAKAIADSENSHYEVSCKPFDSLITVIGANEDNASVHHQFYKMQTREEV